MVFQVEKKVNYCTWELLWKIWIAFFKINMLKYGMKFKKVYVKMGKIAIVIQLLEWSFKQYLLWQLMYHLRKDRKIYLGLYGKQKKNPQQLNLKFFKIQRSEGDCFLSFLSFYHGCGLVKMLEGFGFCFQILLLGSNKDFYFWVLFLGSKKIGLL